MKKYSPFSSFVALSALGIGFVLFPCTLAAPSPGPVDLLEVAKSQAKSGFKAQLGTTSKITPDPLNGEPDVLEIGSSAGSGLCTFSPDAGTMTGDYTITFEALIQPTGYLTISMPINAPSGERVTIGLTAHRLGDGQQVSAFPMFIHQGQKPVLPHSPPSSLPGPEWNPMGLRIKNSDKTFSVIIQGLESPPIPFPGGNSPTGAISFHFVGGTDEGARGFIKNPVLKFD